MAVIINYELKNSGGIVKTTLTASDTAVVNLTSVSTLIVENNTGGALTVNIKGDDATSFACAGVGYIDLSGGVDEVINDGETYRIALNPSRQKWLGNGNLTITGGAGCEAHILTV